MQIINTNLIKSILLLLPEKSIKKLRYLIAFQVGISSLDVLALFLLANLLNSGIDYINGNPKLIFTSNFKIEGMRNLNYEQQFTLLGIIVIILFASRTILAIWGSKKAIDFIGLQSANASKTIMRRLFETKPQYVISKKTHELLYGMTTGIDNLVLSYLGAAATVISEILFLVIILCSLIYMEPIAGLTVFLIFGGSALLIHKKVSSTAREKSESSSGFLIAYNQQIIETLTLFRELYLRAGTIDYARGIERLREDYLRIRSDLMFLPIFSKYLFEFTLILGGAIVALTQLAMFDSRRAIVAVVIFLAASTRILPSVVRLQSSLLLLKSAEGAGLITIHQLEEFNVNREVYQKYEDHSEDTPLVDLGLVSVENVNFIYPEAKEYALRDISFSIKQGQLVAIVGESGSGKSTLADVILGIQEPTEGSVFLNGKNPRNLIRENPGFLAYVPQSIAIMDGSIGKNVSLADICDSDLSLIEESLRKASLWEDIRKLPQGLESIVGERGGRLSGGQRQRLGIARALYAQPGLIVFDEATSSLDPLTERAVTDAIYRKDGNTTLIVIAHRLSTVKNADVVLLLSKGRLVAVGTFEEVRAKVPNFDEQARLANL